MVKGSIKITRVKITPCPKCGSVVHYKDNYHQSAFKEQYAMCKNCGYWKKDKRGEKPKQCNLFWHFCKEYGDSHQRNGFCWIAQDHAECEFCEEKLTKKIKWIIKH